MSQESQIEYIALAGGGVKGVLYGGFVEALENTDLIKDLKGFSGTSAGSNIGALLAFGMSAKDLKNKVLDVDLSKKLGKGYFGWFNDGEPIIDLVNTLLIDTIQNNIQGINVDDINHDKDKEEFTKFQESLKGPKLKITFGHLALLRKIKPATFKDLYITAVSKKDKALEIFSSASEAHKNISIAEACRASSSLPLLFSPADINGKKYLDGGLKNNIPFTAFLDNTNSIEQNKKGENHLKEQDILSKTLVCTLNTGGRSIEDNSIYKVLHGKDKTDIWEPTIMERVLILIMRALGLLHKDYINDTNQQYITLKDQIRFNILNLDTKGLTLTAFDKANAMGEEKYLKGYFSTMEYLINHEKLNHLDESQYKVLVDKTRLQECFFKIITGANLNRDSQLYRDLMQFCGDTKFSNLNTDDINDINDIKDIKDIRDKFNKDYNNHTEWKEKDQQYINWKNQSDKSKDNEPKSTAWENAKKAYEKAYNNYIQWKQTSKVYKEWTNGSDILKDIEPKNTDWENAKKAYEKASDNHTEWKEKDQQYINWKNQYNTLKGEEPKNQDWENAKEAISKIVEYNKDFKDVSYMQQIVKAFAGTINESNERSADKAIIKLQKSLNIMLNDPYIASKNIKELFKGVRFEQSNSQGSGITP